MGVRFKSGLESLEGFSRFRKFSGFKYYDSPLTIQHLIIQQLIEDYVTAKKIEAQKDAERPYERQYKTGRYDCFWNLWFKIIGFCMVNQQADRIGKAGLDPPHEA